jgi:TetR/AcrR family transcriptional repressor of nem operon
VTEPTPRRAETRQRILAAAGRLFRAQGVDATGVDAVMREAGLTHGGFYLHFPSKEALAAEVAQTLLQTAAEKWDDLSRSADPQTALTQIVQAYLDSDRVASARCCALTTLGADVARRPSSRTAIGGALRRMLEALARCLPGQRRDRAMAILSTMVGAVVLARLADDPTLSDAFLDTARTAVLQPPDVAETPKLPTSHDVS